ncbi:MULTISPECIES: Asp-tRNA(Asn)/Glu-tRNA(Gln) amidotransferase subunit GatA [Caproicibacterium]|jgi:aspartyl-tRNA(Asn)/glutamyl-tRNA(Gln) amidotransferase subunit A|uniref:Glutamyl-tRNA(Gln) amidotransferase subunit A n=1 Tax=Caproicibacterium lactatifermentans TaxID=2666138 RepID=A0A859DSN9_9FIRM|nr:Asp-tRNA(Asn)/Glu-tRNA(Gln) amidotransferase subunit GatA [Caproicibacterium lactatifermentans]ARP50446.1 aspartyl/glutamyl-tRNA amidotransferase subunit A [Ruminococcaceae bacterium CPB6]MDD4807791.1 Asp-tRNA(Asn)/Glu-tRNA(Gln) amidotransferase subunit GatA [Oscillospiraceae bacterium]QKN23832.1 Asp-tRNA(Asn)/Glu-tRNA(Gln) amidotransferase subunit GatA [Caproicibacterium lactatifermentans]QKO31096.1 Asp-tRNA(Asn)/Glu-tRNA(Gln) amidotransferase subunit GatA [Caproicibacterium lactatifermenta
MQSFSTIHKIQDLYRKRECSCTELTRRYLQTVQRENDDLRAYTCVTEKTALAAAEKVDRKLAAGEPLGPVEGVPMTLKANISTRGIDTDCCSRILSGYRPVYDAAVWQILQQQGAVLLGKSNMDEFAMGSSCETSCYGGARNPHNTGCVAGGSSGGAASAVSAGLAAYGIGSDTGGSIRQPASFCGIVGLKPTYGAVSRYGLIAYASSFDQIGPLANCAEDAAILFDVLSQKDPCDSTCTGARCAAVPALQQSLKGKRVGLAAEYFDGLQPDVQVALEQAQKVYQGLGAELVPLSIPEIKYALPVYYILACAEASSNLGRYDGIRYGIKAEHYTGVNDMIAKTRSAGFGKEVKRRILLGTYVLSAGYYDAYYKKAQMLRRKIRHAFESVFQQCDFLLAPTVPRTAFPFGFTAQDAVETYQTDICTVPVNIVGLPAVSVPCGFDGQGMPVGMQLIGGAGHEDIILNAAHQYELAARADTFRSVSRLQEK